MSLQKNMPAARKVASRMYVLLGVATRALLENDIPPEQAEDARKQINQWLTELGLNSLIEAGERKLLESPVGEVPRQHLINAIWRFEGVAVLAWSLGLFDKGADDSIVSPPIMTQALKFLSPDSMNIISAARLREKGSLDEYFAQIFSVHWRLTDYRIKPERKDFAAVVKKTKFGLSLDGLQMLEGDMAAGGRPIFTYDLNEISTFCSIANERHIAMEWLFGQHSLYNQVQPHT